VDTVISTVSGSPQLALIEAAANVHVRRFVPSEFEGSPGLRPVGDVLDRGKRAALQRLQQYQQYGMDYTVFTCGIFYERFAPGGMGSLNIGTGTGVAAEGDYVMDVRRMKASVPHYNSAGNVIHICLTSAQDVARFIVAALDLPNWPTELRMRGDRLSVLEVVQEAETMRGKSKSPPTRNVHSPIDRAVFRESVLYSRVNAGCADICPSVW
jgi:nucleoside-diphosphate-sugar epimerase